MLVKTDPAIPNEAAASTSAPQPLPPSYEEALREPAQRLHAQIDNYNALEQLDRSSNHDDEAQKVAAAMRDVGDQHPDPKVKKAWHEKSKKFARATRRARREILDGVGHGPLHMLISLPCAVVGVALCVASGALHVVGSVLGGVGNALSGGSHDDIRGYRRESREARREGRWEGRRSRRNSDSDLYRRGDESYRR